MLLLGRAIPVSPKATFVIKDAAIEMYADDTILWCKANDATLPKPQLTRPSV